MSGDESIDMLRGIISLERSDQAHRFLAFGVQSLAIHIVPLACGLTDLWRTC